MSDELIEAETAAVPVTKKKLEPATILGLLLLVAALSLGFYIVSIWRFHNSRISRLKARDGDFVQLEHRAEEEENPPPRGARGARVDDESAAGEAAEQETKEPAWYDQYLTEIFPKPIQIVYWREPTLTSADVDLIKEFQDLEVLSVNCDEIESASIEKFLELPKLRRLNVQAKKLDTSTIASWKVGEEFRNLSLINTSWTESDIDEVKKVVETNSALKGKVNLANAARPNFAGG